MKGDQETLFEYVNEVLKREKNVRTKLEEYNDTGDGEKRKGNFIQFQDGK